MQQNVNPKESGLTPDINSLYNQGLLELKQKTLTFFDSMNKFDLNFQEDREDACALAQGLKAEIDDLCRKHLQRNHCQLERQLNVESLNLEVKCVKDFKEKGIIGGKSTLVAVKNHNSFLIGTNRKGFILMENGVQIFSGNLNEGHQSLGGLLYTPSLNCYFSYQNSRIFRKKINNQRANLFMGLELSYRSDACFKYSNLHKRLIINKASKKSQS